MSDITVSQRHRAVGEYYPVSHLLGSFHIDVRMLLLVQFGMTISPLMLHFCFAFCVLVKLLLRLIVGPGFLYGFRLGKKGETCLWYSPYSGYFPDVISSVSHVEPWNSMIKNKEPNPAQPYRVLLA